MFLDHFSFKEETDWWKWLRSPVKMSSTDPRGGRKITLKESAELRQLLTYIRADDD
jgi:hypothetical protein